LINKSKVKSQLIIALNKSLPGIAAHIKMAPDLRKQQMQVQKMNFPKTATIAAVLCLIYPIKNQLHFVLMKRVSYPGVHSGQISFPGGKLEENETPFDAAIRETFEEIGYQTHPNHIIGQLTKIFIPPSNFIVYPFLAFVENQPNFIADKTEVDYIIEVPIADLLDNKNVQSKKMKTKGISFDAPYFSLKDEIAWGATAIMLSEVKELFLLNNIKIS